MLSNEEKILANSRLTVSNSYYTPVIMGCIILAAIYFTSGESLSNVFFGWVWFLLAAISLYKHLKDRKKIKEMKD